VIAYPGFTTEDGSATFYPTGDIDPSTIVVIADADGRLPGGLTEAQVAELIVSGKAGSGVEAPGDQLGITPLESTSWISGSNCEWGRAYEQTSLGITRDDGGRVTYIWWVTYGQANGQAWGFYKGYNGSDFGVWGKWYPVGRSSESAPSLERKPVPWEGTWGLPKFRAASTYCVLAAIGGFQVPL
jgi:hypothetical protein